MTGAHAHPDLAEAAAVESLAVRVLGLVYADDGSPVPVRAA